ncbi:MAG: GntR family transcriptional regulator [Rhodobacteraceae bacterium]|nr:GntR family transcriptional regulator [Paracoccaceae bacterium]
MESFGIGKIDQSKLREEVYTLLCRAFMRGEFPPGAILNLRSLAQELGTSMTPVREAIRRLVAEGALVDTPSRTLQVPTFSQERMLDLKRARIGIEIMVLDIALENIDTALIDRLEQIIDNCRDSSGPDLQTNYDFHFALYRQSGSKVMLPLIEALWLQYGPYLNLIIRHKEAQDSEEHKYHKQIVSALRSGDKTAARDALRADLERSFQFLATDSELDVTAGTTNK